MALLNWLGMLIKKLVGIIFPIFAQARKSKGLSVGLRWVLHFILLAAVVGGLLYVNQSLHVPGWIPGSFRFLAKGWLPILFLLVYVLAWVGWWLWKLLAAEDEMTDFPDIDQAWDAAVGALDQAGIRLAEAPLFLILGQPAQDEKALFQASLLQLQVKHAPPWPNAPLHVYANRDAIFVTCAGASLLGRHAAILAGKAATEEALAPSGGTGGGEEDALMATLRPETAPAAVRNIREIMKIAEREGRPLTEAEKREIRAIERRDSARPSLLKNLDEVELQTARLKHLSRLMLRDRHPYCPVNGILVLVPFAGTDGEQEAVDTGDIVRRDLATARQALKVHCPVFGLVSDLEGAPGFSAFVERFTAKERLQRVGQRCPLLPDLRQFGDTGDGDPNRAHASMLDSLSSWVCNAVVAGWVYKKFQVEKQPQDKTPVIVRDNAWLFLFLDQLRERQKRLGTILTRGIAAGADEPILFGGCYLAGTGADVDKEQAFVAGVFRRLIDEQDYVSWTDEALAEEAACSRWVGLGYTFILVLVVGSLAALGYAFFGSGSKIGPKI
ncbi:MAG: type VI secretion protein IcmF/TssM N-terminal domain-containing protein [Gemmataceae bacterium]